MFQFYFCDIEVCQTFISSLFQKYLALVPFVFVTLHIGLKCADGGFVVRGKVVSVGFTKLGS